MVEELWNDSISQLVIWGALGVTLIAIAVYVVGKIRAETAKKEPSASELISKFRELHSRGGLSEEEFRTIKAKLASRLHSEISDKAETG